MIDSTSDLSSTAAYYGNILRVDVVRNSVPTHYKASTIRHEIYGGFSSCKSLGERQFFYWPSTRYSPRFTSAACAPRHKFGINLTSRKRCPWSTSEITVTLSLIDVCRSVKKKNRKRRKQKSKPGSSKVSSHKRHSNVTFQKRRNVRGYY